MNLRNSDNIPLDHPRYGSLKLRAQMIEAYKAGLLADSGLIAHGRGEAFDYLLGEKTISMARKAMEAAAAYLVLAQNPVISVNGNTAALAPEEIVSIAAVIGAKLEINLFYGTQDRVEAIYKVLKDAGAEEVLGLGENPEHIPRLESPRSRASREGVYKADVVLVPLEDGDRAEALVLQGKKVLTVDLNPLSRTSKTATVTIVDNLVRVIPYLEKEVIRIQKMDKSQLQRIVDSFHNEENLQDTLDMLVRTYVTRE